MICGKREPERFISDGNKNARILSGRRYSGAKYRIRQDFSMQAEALLQAEVRHDSLN